MYILLIIKLENILQLKLINDVLLGGRSLVWQLRCRVINPCLSFVVDCIRCDKLCTEASFVHIVMILFSYFWCNLPKIIVFEIIFSHYLLVCLDFPFVISVYFRILLTTILQQNLLLMFFTWKY